ncbi:hypothetical protein TorRG33x02_003070, partial [Trema orientale]
EITTNLGVSTNIGTCSESQSNEIVKGTSSKVVEGAGSEVINGASSEEAERVNSEVIDEQAQK